MVNYPFQPKSTAYMRKGQFWPIPIEGGFACGIVLDIEKNSRTVFLAGLLDWVGTQKPTTSDLECSIVVEQGEGHIKMIGQRGSSIIGELPNPLSPLIWTEHLGGPDYGLFEGLVLIDRITCKESEVYSKRSTWGDNVINILADKFGVNR